jgi:hypothetical protein
LRKFEVKVVEALFCPLGILVVGKDCVFVPFLEECLLFAGKLLLAYLFRQRKKKVQLDVGDVVRLHGLFRFAPTSSGAE